MYKASDTRLNRAVAIKVLPSAFAADPERLQRFEQRAAAALNHPNVLAVYDIGHHDAAPFIVSERLVGHLRLRRDSLRNAVGPPGLRGDTAMDVMTAILRG